ncbi:hypothetical protein THOM_1373 [Trachipleistophora hominis]|uniref:Uncharacterized protein n=1 Tax=Trachipleistophora hominis TaxID=72359 RepID=L7JXE7_TRAHO|nr:hypothetical protein THOM_1373 [Trachipleistophora hominis]
MDVLRSLLTDGYEISDKKIIADHKIIDNKYIEIEEKTYTLLQILFYVQHETMPFEMYAKLALENDIPVVDSKLMYYLAEKVYPLEKYDKNKFNLQYDFRFILNHVVRKEYVILVPASYSSKINIFNCLNVFSTGSFKNPPLDIKNMLVNEHKLKRKMEMCTANFIFMTKWHGTVHADVVAVFLDGSEWQISTLLDVYKDKYDETRRNNDFDINQSDDFFGGRSKWACPVYFVHTADQQICNTNYEFEDVLVENEAGNFGLVNKIWRDIENYLKRTSF